MIGLLGWRGYLKSVPSANHPIGTNRNGRGLKKMAKENEKRDKSTLEEFLTELRKYTGETKARGWIAVEKRERLQRKIPLVSQIVDRIYGDAGKTINKQTFSFSFLLSHILKQESHESYATEESEIRKNEIWTEISEHVEDIINQTIGCIEDDVQFDKEIVPTLPIRDEKLKERCLDLLNAPGCFDRVLNQATQVLEERIRNSVTYEYLCELLPQAKTHIGETLVNRLLGGSNPIVVISDKQLEREAFHKMVVGIVSYLRNPSHHTLTDSTEWSLAWSVVGLVDSILSQLSNAYVSNGKTQRTEEEKSI